MSATSERVRRELVRIASPCNPAINYAALGVAAAAIIIVVVSSLASILVEGWAQSDARLESRTGLRSIHEQIAFALAEKRDDSVEPFLNGIAEDERILALGLCTPTDSKPCSATS